MLVTLLLACGAQLAGPSGDWIIPAGTTVTYDTLAGAAHVNKLIIEPGATLRVTGPRPFVVFATQRIQIDGTLDASGFQAKSVFTILTPNQPEPGAAGAAGGGAGGTGSPLTDASDPKGGDGLAVLHPLGLVVRGGAGGETGYSGLGKQESRGAGGGGGALGPDVIGGDVGLMATAGGPGHPLGKGALSGGTAPAQGGQPGRGVFQDADPLNDFFGRKLDPLTGAVIVGELATPLPGAGGGAGGDSIDGDAFPTIPFVLPGPIYKDRKGAGGGGGGGLVALLAREIELGAAGSVHVDGGAGGQGESAVGAFHVAGSSGGGSGGMLMLQAQRIDLSQAGADALTAIGGIGAIDVDAGGPLLTSGGGNGGPGLIQLHVRDAAHDLLLPAGLGLADLSAPDGHVLLPAL